MVAIRRACESLPEVREEIDGFGHKAFRVRGKSFVFAGMGENGSSLAIKSDRTNQHYLIERGPYYRTPYIGQHGWISVDRPLERNWEEISSLIVDGWLLAAPRRLARTVRVE